MLKTFTNNFVTVTFFHSTR